MKLEHIDNRAQEIREMWEDGKVTTARKMEYELLIDCMEAVRESGDIAIAAVCLSNIRSMKIKHEWEAA